MTEQLATFLRRHDPDRFLTALFTPPDKRGALFALYAFNHELARAREVVSEPMLALIRLQWWREVVEGAARRHEVAEPLSAAIEAGLLQRADLLSLIAAREIEADPTIPTIAAWRDYVLGSAGGLAVAAGRLLDAPEPERLRPFGAAYGVAGLLRSIPVLARQGRCLLPEDVLAAHDLSPEEVIGAPTTAKLAPVLRALTAEGAGLLAEGRRTRPPRAAIAAALPAVLARRDLARPPFAHPPGRGLGDKLAVVVGGMLGRI
jgi:phytoene synthase